MEFSQIVTLIQTVSASSLEEFEMKDKDIKLYMKRGGCGNIEPIMQPTVEKLSLVSVPEVEEEKQGELVCSPLVGIFYEAPKEDAPPFVQVGDRITKGQILGIVEAMKLMNEIESEVEGQVEEILIKNGEPVEFGQPLFRVTQNPS